MSYRILVADKDPGSKDTIQNLLAQDNECVGVSSSSELKKEIKKEKPDLIILNSSLTDSPAWSAVQQVVKGIKGSVAYGDIPVLVMTGDPGSPVPAELNLSGADGYFTKPINATTLRMAVDSALGLAGSDDSGDEEIMIDFADDDSGDMTEELLAMSNVALEDEPSTDVGDTVEIDTGTLVAELDHTSAISGEDTYEDTVRLNLEDMGLEDDVDDTGSFEPTIELVTDMPSDFDSADQMEAADISGFDIELDTEDNLPDFGAVTGDIAPATDAKDSITVDMDIEGLGLELESDVVDMTESSITSRVERIDPEDTEIGKILEIQEPSNVLTSEDLMLDDESIARDTTTAVVDVIDLEDDTEIGDVALDELEGIHTAAESIAVDLEEFGDEEELEFESDVSSEFDDIPEEELELEPEAAGAFDDIPLELESPLESAQAASAEDELELDQLSEDEQSTQEWFGEEMPTEEFPTERFPEDRTVDHNQIEEISLDGIDTISTAELSIDDITVDTGFIEELSDDQPNIEITQDIDFSEITIDKLPETIDAAQKPEEPISFKETYEESPLTISEPALEQVAQASSQEPSTSSGIGLGTFGAVVGATTIGLAGAALAHKAFGEKDKPEAPVSGIQPSAEASPVSGIPERTPPIVAEKPSEAHGQTGSQPLGPIDLKELAILVAAELQKQAPSTQQLLSKEEIVASVNESIKAAVPTKDEILSHVMEGFNGLFPSQLEVTEKIDKAVESAIPDREHIEKRLDEYLSKAVQPEEVVNRVESILTSIPFDSHLHAAINTKIPEGPSAEMIQDRLESAFQLLPKREDIDARIEHALAGLPTKEDVDAKITEALSRIPSPDEFRAQIERSLEDLSKAQEMLDRLESTLKTIPNEQEINERLGSLSAESIMDKVDNLLSKLPTREDIDYRLDSALSVMPSSEDITSRVDATFRSIEEKAHEKLDQNFEIFPSSEMVLERIDAALNSFPKEDQINIRIDSVIDKFPSSEAILTKMDSALMNFPTRDEIENRIDGHLKSYPTAEELQGKIDAMLTELIGKIDIEAKMHEALTAFDKEDISRRIDSALRDVIQPEIINRRFEEILAAMPTHEAIMSRVNAALVDIPSGQEINERMNQALSNMPTQELVNAQFAQMIAALPSADSVHARISEALSGLPHPDEIRKRFDELFSQMPTGDELRQRTEDVFNEIPTKNMVREQLESLLTKAVPPELFAEKLEASLRGIPSPGYIQLRFNQAFDAFPSRDVVDERIRMALSSIPNKTDIHARLDEFFRSLPNEELVAEMIRQFMGALPQTQQIMSIINDKVDSMLPAKLDVVEEVHQIVRSRVEDILSQTDLQSALERVIPEPNTVLEAITSALPDRERLREALSRGFTEAIENSLPERMWLESVSRGLFDEKMRGLLPRREEIVDMLQSEIKTKLYEVMERTIRSEIEKIVTG